MRVCRIWDFHHGLLDLKIPYYDPIKGRLRSPKGLIAQSGYLDPKVCRIVTAGAILKGVGLLCCLLWGFQAGLRVQD